MWPFDYFKKKCKKKEAELRCAEEHAGKQKLEQQRIVKGSERHLEENKRKDAERKARMEKGRNVAHAVSPFSKDKITMLINACDKIIYLFKNSNALKESGNSRVKKITGIMLSYKCILMYLYEVDYHYGNVEGVFFNKQDNDTKVHYAFVYSSLLDKAKKEKILKDLSSNWNDILTVLESLKLSGEQVQVNTISKEINELTSAFAKLSGIEPVRPVTLNRKDKYVEMIENASFNPFHITCDANLQPKQKMPDIRSVFRKELNDLYVKVRDIPNFDTKSIIIGYTFNLVESYYNNAGYVPKEALDQILEQVYDAMQMTNLNNVFPSFDSLKYTCYYGYLHK